MLRAADGGLRGLDIAQVLDLTVESAAVFFAGTPAAERGLRTLLDVGLGCLRLGRPATELSGGEAQRIKLAAELQRTRRGQPCTWRTSRCIRPMSTC